MTKDCEVSKIKYNILYTTANITLSTIDRDVNLWYNSNENLYLELVPLHSIHLESLHVSTNYDSG